SNYAQFLKQPLRLEMFVPCDEEGNVLEVPTDTTSMRRNQKIEQYNEAKEKVLFEGFKINTYSNGTKYISGFCKTYLIYPEGLYDDNNNCAPTPTKDMIESLLEYCESKIELTPTAIKQIQP